LDDLQLQIGAQRVDALDLGLDLVRDSDRVRARLLADAHPDRGQAVDLDVAADVAIAELDVGDVAHADGVAVDDRDDGARDLVDRRELAERADVEVAQALAHVAARQIDVLAREGVHDVACRELAREQPVAPQIDVDLAIDAAPDLDRADARDLLEPPHQIALENPRELRE